MQRTYIASNEHRVNDAVELSFLIEATAREWHEDSSSISEVSYGYPVLVPSMQQCSIHGLEIIRMSCFAAKVHVQYQ